MKAKERNIKIQKEAVKAGEEGLKWAISRGEDKEILKRRKYELKLQRRCLRGLMGTETQAELKREAKIKAQLLKQYTPAEIKYFFNIKV